MWTQTKTSAHLEGGNIYCLPKAGSPVIRVSSDSGNVTGPAWNPDGSQILYVATGEDQEGHDYEKAWFTIVNCQSFRFGDEKSPITPGANWSKVAGIEPGRDPGCLCGQVGCYTGNSLH